jgi:small subunit ribosomal protein S17
MVNMKKSIGLNVKEPEKKCEDVKCPWHGKLSIRGKVFEGVVKASKMHNTAVIEFGYHKFIPKYERYERRRVRISAHNPPCIKAKDGDNVVIAECRPLSKTKSFVIVGFSK